MTPVSTPSGTLWSLITVTYFINTTKKSFLTSFTLHTSLLCITVTYSYHCISTFTFYSAECQCCVMFVVWCCARASKHLTSLLVDWVYILSTISHFWDVYYSTMTTIFHDHGKVVVLWQSFSNFYWMVLLVFKFSCRPQFEYRLPSFGDQSLLGFI